MKTFTWKSLLNSLLLSLAAGAATCAIWRAGLIDPLQAAFVVNVRRGETPLQTPQMWLGLLLIVGVSVSAGFFVGRAGARRSFWILGVGFIVTACGSLLTSWLLKVNIIFAPLALGACSAVILVQLYRLWLIDTLLTDRVNETSNRTGLIEGTVTTPQLGNGLKLLQTILPLEESVVFQPDETGQLVPCAQLRSNSNGTIDSARNSIWRQLVRLCDRALHDKEIAIAAAGTIDALETVAIPLMHEGRTVGVLLLRLRESFDQSDRRLLEAVGSQIARNVQREEARKKKLDGNLPAFVSARTSSYRLHAFDFLSGVMTQQRFGAEVLAEAPDAYALAYLDGTLAYLNPAMLKATRLKAHELEQTDLFGLLDRFKSGVFDEPSIAVRRVLQSGQPYERELSFPERNQTLQLRISIANDSKSGSETSPVDRQSHEMGSTGLSRQNSILDHVNHRVKPLPDVNGNGAHDPHPLCFTIRVSDVSRMKEFEKLKSDMISLMSHELRTPLTSINGFSELLTVDDKIPEESREFVQIIANESQRMARMIDTFLSVTQLERADKQEVVHIPLRLDDLVREVITTMQPVAKKKRIRMVDQASGTIPPVAADKSLITQVLMKLLDNAIRYSPERTTITVTTLLEAEVVRVIVEDRGYGVPADSIDRIWDKFYRVARDGQEKDEESTGLGLAFVKEVVEQHGGSVNVESEVGRGSKFSFALPRL
ncbi:MAG TPA: ATP-binding protein [Pyrinomonadaceae bacterium]|nr:ATP-binding protein [Pyrinomonadaceae bacterium]